MSARSVIDPGRVETVVVFAGDGRVGLDDGFSAFEALLGLVRACGPEIAALSGDLAG